MFGFSRLLSLIDFFKQNKQFSVSTKANKLYSIPGAVFSLTIIAISLKYAIEKGQYLVKHGGQNIITVTKENAFGGNDWLNLTVG